MQKKTILGDLPFYERTIVEATNCEIEDASKIKHIMRDDVFHSTLDWLSPTQFHSGARTAYKMLQENRADYEAWFAAVRRNFEEGKARHEAETQTV